MGCASSWRITESLSEKFDVAPGHGELIDQEPVRDLTVAGEILMPEVQLVRRPARLRGGPSLPAVEEDVLARVDRVIPVVPEQIGHQIDQLAGAGSDCTPGASPERAADRASRFESVSDLPDYFGRALRVCVHRDHIQHHGVGDGCLRLKNDRVGGNAEVATRHIAPVIRRVRDLLNPFRRAGPRGHC